MPTSTPTSDSNLARDLRELRLAFTRETQAILCLRLRQTNALFALVMIVSGVVTVFFLPERRAIWRTALLVELGICAATEIALRLPRVRDWPRTIAVAFGAGVVAIVSWHIGKIPDPAFRLATAYIILLSALPALLPWGWRAQATMSVAAGIGLVVTLSVSPFALEAADVTHAGIVLAAAIAAGTLGTASLERYRFDAFIRSGLHERAAGRERSHAELLEVIRRAQSMYISCDNAQDLFEHLLDDLRALTHSRVGVIAEVADRRDGNAAVRILAGTAAREIEGGREPAASASLQCVIDTVVASGHEVTSTDPGLADLAAGAASLDAFLALPLHHGDELVGVVALANAPGGYEAAGGRTLHPLAATYGAIIAAQRHVISRAAAEESFRNEAELTACLADAGREMIGLVTEPAILDRLCHLTQHALNADVALTIRWVPEAATTQAVAVAGLSPAEASAALAAPVPGALVRTVAASEGDLVIGTNGLDADSVAALGLPPLDGGHLLSFRVGCRGETIALQLAGRRRSNGQYSTTERRAMDGLARIASMALTTARSLHDLQHANQLKSEFVSTMSHELRTPLNVIIGYLEMVRDEPTDEQRHDLLDRMHAASRDLLELIESTLDLSRMEAGQDEVRRERLCWSSFWTETGATCRRLPRREGVELYWSEPSGGEIVTDPHKLATIVRNLVGNALKFTSAGHVRVDAWVGDATLTMRVEDTGIGILPEDQETVFDMFRQADGSDSRRYGGSGLGLYLVRRFAQQLGGTVTLASIPGVGSTFTVTLAVPVVATDLARPCAIVA